jgi:hypothetical protein
MKEKRNWKQAMIASAVLVVVGAMGSLLFTNMQSKKAEKLAKHKLRISEAA